MLKLSKQVKTHISEGLGKRIPLYLPMVIVWAATGMWHGSEMKYVVWGLLNCFFIILGTELEPFSVKLMERLKLSEDMPAVKLYRVFKTFWLMAFLRVFDISSGVRAGFETIRDCFTDWGGFDLTVVYNDLALEKEELIVALIAVIILFAAGLLQRKGSLRERIFKLPVPVQWVSLCTLITAVVIFGTYGMGYDAKSFIYLMF